MTKNRHTPRGKINLVERVSFKSALENIFMVNNEADGEMNTAVSRPLESSGTGGV
jgi:hypothetical protein